MHSSVSLPLGGPTINPGRGTRLRAPEPSEGRFPIWRGPCTISRMLAKNMLLTRGNTLDLDMLRDLRLESGGGKEGAVYRTPLPHTEESEESSEHT